jgi:hypothetical protein
MAWRPTQYLIEGVLNNTKPGKVTGWMQFAGKKERIVFDLTGDFHRDIRGAKIYFKGQTDIESVDAVKAAEYMKGFSLNQTGKAGDMTAGFAPADYVSGRVYLEWYSEANGRVVIELPQENVEVIGKPVPWEKCKPVSRQQQAENMADFLQGLAEQFKLRK